LKQIDLPEFLCLQI